MYSTIVLTVTIFDVVLLYSAVTLYNKHIKYVYD